MALLEHEGPRACGGSPASAAPREAPFTNTQGLSRPCSVSVLRRPRRATEIAELRSTGMKVLRADNDIRHGIAAVTARIRTKPSSSTVRPALTSSPRPNCTATPPPRSAPTTARTRSTTTTTPSPPCATSSAGSTSASSPASGVGAGWTALPTNRARRPRPRPRPRPSAGARPSAASSAATSGTTCGKASEGERGVSAPWRLHLTPSPARDPAPSTPAHVAPANEDGQGWPRRRSRPPLGHPPAQQGEWDRGVQKA